MWQHNVAAFMQVDMLFMQIYSETQKYLDSRTDMGSARHHSSDFKVLISGI